MFPASSMERYWAGCCCCNKLLAFQLNLYSTFIVCQYSPCLESDEGDIVCCSREVSDEYNLLPIIHSFIIISSIDGQITMKMILTELQTDDDDDVDAVVDVDVICGGGWYDCDSARHKMHTLIAVKLIRVRINSQWTRVYVYIWCCVVLGLLSASQLIALRYITLTLHSIRI